MVYPFAAVEILQELVHIADDCHFSQSSAAIEPGDGAVGIQPVAGRHAGTQPSARFLQIFLVT